MLRRMVLPMAAVAVLVGGLGFAYQAFRSGEGVATTAHELLRGDDHHERD